MWRVYAFRAPVCFKLTGAQGMYGGNIGTMVSEQAHPTCHSEGGLNHLLDIHHYPRTNVPWYVHTGMCENVPSTCVRYSSTYVRTSERTRVRTQAHMLARIVRSTDLAVEEEPYHVRTRVPWYVL